MLRWCARRMEYSPIMGGEPDVEPCEMPVLPSEISGGPSSPASSSAISVARVDSNDPRPMVRIFLRVQWSGTSKPCTGPPSLVCSPSTSAHSGMA